MERTCLSRKESLDIKRPLLANMLHTPHAFRVSLHLPQQRWVSRQPSSLRQCQRLCRATWCTPALTRWCTPPRRRWLTGGLPCSTPSPREPRPCRCPTSTAKTQVGAAPRRFRQQGQDWRRGFRFLIFLCFPAQVPSLRCSSQHLQARCRSLSQRCSYTQYGKICISQVKLSYSLCNQHATLTSLMHLNRALGTQATGLHPVRSLLNECGVFSWHLVGFYLLPNTYRIHQTHKCILVRKELHQKEHLF